MKIRFSRIHMAAAPYGEEDTRGNDTPPAIAKLRMEFEKEKVQESWDTVKLLDNVVCVLMLIQSFFRPMYGLSTAGALVDNERGEVWTVVSLVLICIAGIFDGVIKNLRGKRKLHADMLRAMRISIVDELRGGDEAGSIGGFGQFPSSASIPTTTRIGEDGESRMSVVPAAAAAISPRLRKTTPPPHHPTLPRNDEEPLEEDS